MTQYPKWIYSATLPAQLVADHDAHVEAGPGWFESPGEAQASQATGAATDQQDDPPADPPALEPAAAAVTDAATREQQEKEALWAAPIAAIVEKLAGAPADLLTRVQAFERENPKGARKGLLTAVDAALKAGAQ